MATAVITGGTEGIGRALADTYLDRGHEVLIVGTSTDKGRAFQDYAASRGAGERARFLRADLSRVTENQRVIDFGGAGRTGPVRWDDLQLRRDYPGTGALGHSGALCDLLGVHFTNIHADTAIHYVLNHPGVVATSFAGEYDAATANAVEHLRVSGKPVPQAVAQILPFLDAPPARLTAVLEGVRVATDTAAFDPGDAARLHQHTEELLR